MYSVQQQRKWKKKEDWRDDYRRISCAYCYFDCEMDRCISNDFYCDNFLPNE